MDWKSAADSGHIARSCRDIHSQRDAERSQRIKHAVGVIGRKHIDQRRRSLRQRCQQQ
jgi:hypothetical protein